MLLAAEHVKKTYRLGRVEVPVLRDASIAIGEGEWVAIVGSSGSGKSTLLHLLGGLDRADADSGPIRFGGEDVRAFNAWRENMYRNRDVGFVFQFYHLLPELTVLENAMLPALVGLSRLRWISERSSLRARAAELLETCGLSHRLNHRPAELSGGERQRVAIARADQPAEGAARGRADGKPGHPHRRRNPRSPRGTAQGGTHDGDGHARRERRRARTAAGADHRRPRGVIREKVGVRVGLVPA